MEKFSVKRPFTVLVAVIMVIMLGFVSVTGMQTNLLPNVNTPYLMVVTVYPGASPERVESEVSDVMENGLGNITGVEQVTATSSENFSLLLMRFEETTDMNSALVKVSNKIDQLASGPAGKLHDPLHHRVQPEHECLYDGGCQPGRSGPVRAVRLCVGYPGAHPAAGGRCVQRVLHRSCGPDGARWS